MRVLRLDGENGIEFSDGQSLFLDFEFQPTQNIDGQFSLNVLGNVADKRPLEFTYGDRGLPLEIEVEGELDGNTITRTVALDDRERVEIYDFDATYQGENFDITAFYHTPRFHWGFEGDFFGLVAEATDIYGMDIWNAKAPEGIEIQGKNKWKNLRILDGSGGLLGCQPEGDRQVRL